jgi:hypothetical protein
MARYKDIYKKKPSRIEISSTNMEVDEILIEDYKHGIFPFALSVAIHILRFPSFGSFELWEKKNVVPEYWIKIRDAAKNLERIRDGLMIAVEELDDHLKEILYWDFLDGHHNYVRDLIGFPPSFVDPERISRPIRHGVITKEIYGLSDTIEKINAELEFYNSLGSTRRKQGRPIKAKMAIAVLWSQIIKKEGRTQWKDVKALIAWFHNKFIRTPYGSEISEMPEAEEIRRFKKKYQTEISEERKQIFRQYDNPNNPMGLQINFAEDSPKLGGLGSSEQCRALPTICFPDGTTFPRCV